MSGVNIMITLDEEEIKELRDTVNRIKYKAADLFDMSDALAVYAERVLDVINEASILENRD